MVDLQADGLEAFARRMLFFEALFGRVGGLDELAELQSGLNGLRFSFLYNGVYNTAGKALLPIDLQHLFQALRRISVDDLIGRQLCPAVHTHVQWAVMVVGKAPGFIIKLKGGNPQVINDAVDLRDTGFPEHLFQMNKIIFDKLFAARVRRETSARVVQSKIVLVDTDQGSVCAQAFADQL